MSRKTAREVAMKMAFSRLIGGEDTYESVLEKSEIAEQPSAEDIEFAASLINGIEENIAEIDSFITDSAIGWAIDRMPKVDLCILRISIFEMLYRKDVPVSVSINEAVELAKIFGGEKSSAYVNGLLGSISKKLEDR